MSRKELLKNYRSKTYQELEKELDNLRQELMEERIKIKIGSKDDKKNRIKAIKRNIARLLTVIGEKVEQNE